jgi:putative ABC transport system permease protein
MPEMLSTFVNLVPVTLAQSLAYGFVALAVMIPFRLFNFPDLTCEGSFPLGASVCAALAVQGAYPAAATGVAVVAGFAAGVCTALLSLRLRVNAFLAGILVSAMVWSIDIRIMGRSNVSLIRSQNMFDQLWDGFTRSAGTQVAFWAAITGLVLAAMAWFLRTEIGLAVRTIASNEKMATAQGINVERLTLIGLGTANALSAFAGASIAQVQGYADVGMGLGVLINALAAAMIGEAVVGRVGILQFVCAPFVGSIIYFQIMSLGLAAGAEPSDLKLLTAALVVVALSTSGLTKRIVSAGLEPPQGSR